MAVGVIAKPCFTGTHGLEHNISAEAAEMRRKRGLFFRHISTFYALCDSTEDLEKLSNIGIDIVRVIPPLRSGLLIFLTISFDDFDI